MKDFKKIDEILTRYWQCETSIEEEQILQDFFLNEQNIPPHLLKYQSLFEYRDAKQGVKLSDDFDEKILSQIEAQAKPKTKIVKFRLPQVLKMVAGIALFIGLGLSAHFYQQRIEQAKAHDAVLTALFMISDNLQQGEEMILRSLEQFSPLNPPQGDF